MAVPHLEKGESKNVTFTLAPEDLALVDEQGNLIEKAGEVSIHIGGGQPGKAEGCLGHLTIEGEQYSVY